MGFRYGKLNKDEMFRDIRPRTGPRATTRDQRIRRGKDLISEAIAGIEREPEKPVMAKDYVDEDGMWVE